MGPSELPSSTPTSSMPTEFPSTAPTTSGPTSLPSKAPVFSEPTQAPSTEKVGGAATGDSSYTVTTSSHSIITMLIGAAIMFVIGVAMHFCYYCCARLRGNSEVSVQYTFRSDPGAAKTNGPDVESGATKRIEAIRTKIRLKSLEGCSTAVPLTTDVYVDVSTPELYSEGVTE